MSLTLADIDLLEDTLAEAVPYEQFDLLRRTAPVHWHEHPTSEGFWAVTRYDDVRALPDPHGAVLEFWDSAYRAGARRSAWDFARYDCPQGVTDPLR